MSMIERVAADACPGDVPYALATSDTSRRIQIPDEMRGAYCAFTAAAVDVMIRFGDATVTVSASDVSTVAGGVITAEGTEPHIRVHAGTTVHWRLQGAWTHMADISESTAGRFEFVRAQGAFGAD